MKSLFGRGWLDARTVLVVRCLLTLALVASVLSLGQAVGYYRLFWEDPLVREQFSFILPEVIRFAVAHVLIPLIFALFPRRLTNIVFWASALYLPFPWLEAVLDDGHAVNLSMVEWYALHGIVILGIATYTAMKALEARRRRPGNA